MTYNKEYLLSLIENRVEESLNLEYKSAKALDRSGSKTSEISKDVSAMANSDGGVIIYGICEDEELKHSPKGLDPVKRKDFSKEWLEQIINDKIRPRIHNLKIYPVAINDEEVIYVVEIPKSNTAHQADDKRYYKRFNFQSVAMHDYEIRDVLNRRKDATLELTFGFNGRATKLNVYLSNVGTVVAKYVNVKLRLPKGIVKKSENFEVIDVKTVEFSAANVVREIVDPYAAVARYWPSRYEPVLPKTKFQLLQISLNYFPNDGEIIEWEIFCDNAIPSSGACNLTRELSNS